MPIRIPKSSIFPDWVDDPSVMDSTLQKVVRGGIDILGLNDPSSGLPTPAPLGTVVTGAVKRVAPKRAAMELVDLLLGRSKRVPQIVKPLEGADAAVAAAKQSVIGVRPTAPTELKTAWNEKLFKPQYRRLPRAEGISEAYRANRKLAGLSTNQTKEVYIGSNYKPNNALQSGTSTPAKIPQTVARKELKLEQYRDTAKKHGSIHELGNTTGVRPLTEKEINGMLTGPLKAVKAGLMSPEEAEAVLRANREKIARFRGSLMDADQLTYRGKLQDALMKRQTKANLPSITEKK